MDCWGFRHLASIEAALWGESGPKKTLVAGGVGRGNGHVRGRNYRRGYWDRWIGRDQDVPNPTGEL